MLDAPAGMNGLRNVIVAVVVVTAVLTVAWKLSEQSAITTCLQTGVTPQLARDLRAARTIGNSSRWDFNWDHKHWKHTEDAKGVPTRTLILVRHGRYDHKTGVLDDIGRQQAEWTGKRLQAMDMPFSSIVHSDLPRARETADIILRHISKVQIQQDALLGEGGPVPPDPTVTYWSLPERTYHVDGPRLESAFRKYFFRADRTQRYQSFDILVGHGNIFRYFVLRALQLPAQAWMRFFIAHASITLMHVNPDGTVTMSKLGDTGHQPAKLVSY